MPVVKANVWVRFFPPLSLWLLLVFPSTVRGQYQFDVWNTDNGLPQNSVLSILQTRDGYLWLTTSDGLVRYDGVRFTVFNKANTKGIKSNRLTTLFESHDGALWVGTEEAGIIRYKDGAFTTFTTEDGLLDRWVWGISKNKDGNPLVLTAQGLVQWNNGRFGPYLSDDPVSNHHFTWSERLGGLSFYDATGLHWFKDGHYRTFPLPDGLSSHDFAWMIEDQNGILWSATKGKGFYKLENGSLDFRKVAGLSSLDVRAICRDRAGNLWLGTHDGNLNLLNGDVLSTYGVAQGLDSKVLNVIYEDHEGSIWLGAANGLYRIRKQAIKVYTEQDGLSAKNVYTVYEDHEGIIWIGIWDQAGGLNRFKDGAFTHYTTSDGLSNNLVLALEEDLEGNLWVGTHDKGLNRFKDGRFTFYTTKDGLPGNTILAIHQAKNGALWVGTESGLSRYKDGAFTNYTVDGGLPDRKVQVIHEDREGNLWFGTIGGLSRLRGETFSSYTHRDGLSSDNIRSIYEDSDGVLWIGTYDGGLNRLKDGKFTSYTTAQGLFNNGVFQILEDGRGNLWMSCNLGIYRVSKKDLNDFAEGKIHSIFSISYGKKDGLLNVECNGGRQPAGWKSHDGKLWFPTQNGLAVIDAEGIEVNTQPPPVVIEDFIIDNKPAAFHETVQVQPGQADVEIHYTGLSFVTPENVKFKYKLEGLDNEWVEAGTRRAAYYRYVPPGEYTFRVIAANRDGVWNTQGASVRIVVQPPFWRTRWFMSLAIAILAGLVLIAYKLRVSQLTRAHAAQAAFSRQLIESQENDRKRIAAELHDGLGQSLAIIKNRALVGLNASVGNELTKEQFDQISTQSTQAIDEVKEIAYNLRPYLLDRLGLTKAIESMLNKVAGSSGIHFSADIDQLDGLFSKEEEINLYRIVQESVNNIVKHAGASQAKVLLKRDDRRVDITIQDNGQGFSARPSGISDLTKRGFGLIGISERARLLGGKPIIEPRPGQGTTIKLRLALRNGRV